MTEREIEYVRLGPSRYAARLRELVSGNEKEGLIDTLIVGAFIEARSCERFSKLAPMLDVKLERFYKSLLKSEARHFEDYLQLAQLYSDKDIGDRIEEFKTLENQLINSSDDKFRFHSGVPIN